MTSEYIYGELNKGGYKHYYILKRDGNQCEIAFQFQMVPTSFRIEGFTDPIPIGEILHRIYHLDDILPQYMKNICDYLNGLCTDFPAVQTNALIELVVRDNGLGIILSPFYKDVLQVAGCETRILGKGFTLDFAAGMGAKVICEFV